MTIARARHDAPLKSCAVGGPTALPIGVPVAYDRVVHPIERLRFVARARGVPDDVLAVEAAQALLTFADDPAALTAACRRVLARQPACGPLWWVCARLITAESARLAAWESVELLESDTTCAEASFAVDAADGGEPPVVLLRASAFGSDAALVPSTELEVLHRLEVRSAGLDPRESPEPSVLPAQVWLVGGVGRHLAEPLWETALAHLGTTGNSDAGRVSLHRFAFVVGPQGRSAPGSIGPSDCPVAPELLRLAG